MSSGYQQRQLAEQEQKRLTLPKTNFESSISGWGGKILVCFRQNVIKIDDAMMGYLKRVSAGKFTTGDVYTLLATPVGIGENVKVKKSSMAVKSKATEQATIQEVAKGPVGNRIAGDARVMDEYLKFFGLEVLRDSSSYHRDRAGRENETFYDMMNLGAESEGIMKPLVAFEDDDEIHMAEHDLFFIQHMEEIMQNDALLSYFQMHQEMHRLQDQAKQGQVAPDSMLMVPQAYYQARTAMPANMQTVMQQNQNIKMAQQQQPQQPQQPAAPSQPAPAGSGGPPQTDASAPSANTPQGRKAPPQGGNAA